MKVHYCTGCLPGCRLLALALAQSAAGFDCGSVSWDSGTRHGPGHRLHHIAPAVSLARHCPPPEGKRSIHKSISGIRHIQVSYYFNVSHCGSYAGILQTFNVSCTVTILHSTGHNTEAFSSNSVYHWASIREEMDTPDVQHASIIYKPAGTDPSLFTQLHSSTSRPMK